MFSGRSRQGEAPTGVFFCFRLPALDVTEDEFTLEAGQTRWYYVDLATGEVIENPPRIAPFVRSEPSTERELLMERTVVVDARKKVMDLIRNTYLKRVDAPVSARPRLVCWMEVNDG